MKDMNGKYGANIPMPKGVTSSDGTGSQGSAKKNINSQCMKKYMRI
jgi:hypothetical protein